MPDLYPTRKSAHLTLALEDSLDKQISAFAKQHNVNKSQAVRFIIESFFDNDYEKTVVRDDRTGVAVQS
jgi:hypothetical protein